MLLNVMLLSLRYTEPAIRNRQGI